MANFGALYYNTINETDAFNPETDLAPPAFGERYRQAALRLKQAGLRLGAARRDCFVWDPHGWIPVDSPFPGRVYFILNLGHFVRLLGTVERVKENLVWLPTWHQARLVAERLGVGEETTAPSWLSAAPRSRGRDSSPLRTDPNPN
jgi:hypothetical protein